MRILLANEARRGGGGVETYLASLVDPMTRRGHHIALVYANPSAEEGPTTIPIKDAWSVADEGLDAVLARARVWRPDVCVSHNMRPLDVDERLIAQWPTFKMMHGYFGTCVSGQKAFSFPATVACTRRCDAGCLAYYLPRRCGRLRPDLMLSQYTWAMRQQQLFDRYAGIIVASQHMRREYLRYDVAADRVHAIPLFAIADSAATTAGAPIDVLFVGRMTPLKGPDVLVHAAAHASSALGRRLHVVIAGDGQARARVEELARAFETAGTLSVECPGWIDAATRSALIERASLVAVPSLWPEPFGPPVSKPRNAAVPAVARSTPADSREWLQDGVNGRVVDPALGAKGFGDAIAAVLGDRDLRARLSAGARAAAARLNVDAHATALERVLSCPPTGTS
jgi:glycosyltransferase involved in cell wall biosynthesis